MLATKPRGSFHVCTVLFLRFLIPGSVSVAQAGANLLRNADFQDDWVTLLPETKNHHWCYSSEFYNRRDFNPDGWTCKGSWVWEHAEAPAGQRKLVLHGPLAEIEQRVNWDAIHDDRVRAGFPDAGGFPELKVPRSTHSERLVRDLKFRVRLIGHDLPEAGGEIVVGLAPAGDINAADALGSKMPTRSSAAVSLSSGSFSKWIEVDLPAAHWLDAMSKSTDPKHVDAGAGLPLPGTVLTRILYNGASGSVEVAEAELTCADPETPNLLANGSFERLDTAGYPSSWGQPAKYRYFPPALYYLFNTWHNSTQENRGPVSADALIVHGGNHSLKMIVAAGDEKSVASDPVTLNQPDPRLLEATAWVKTDHLCMLQMDAIDQDGSRLDCFDFINKSPVSMGTSDWRMVRQIFRPRKALKSVRLMLCARGVNGYTLDDVAQQPQNNVVGTIWWDDVHLYEPESTGEELAARGVNAVSAKDAPSQGPILTELDLGQRLLGENELTATLTNSGQAGTFAVRWDFTSPGRRDSHFQTGPIATPAGGQAAVRIPYVIDEPCPAAYTEYRGKLALVDAAGKEVAASDVWFGTWTTPIDLRLGAVYLRPDQTLLVRMNFGFSHERMQRMRSAQLDILRRGTRVPVGASRVPAGPEVFAAQRQKIPAELRGDFANLLLADIDVRMLPVEPFDNPERNWVLVATALDADGKPLASVESIPFCRQAHDAPQPAIQSVAIKQGMTYVNDSPWMPWGAIYGHVPRYAGPADPGEGHYRDLHDLPGWQIYDRFTAASYTREANDFNCLRYVAGSITSVQKVDQIFSEHNLYCSSVYSAPSPVFSVDDMSAAQKGQAPLDAYLESVRTSPAIVSTAPGIEEAFGLFTGASPDNLKGLQEVADYSRRATGKPIMVGHGGYWNRLEFEKAPFFDIYDPETEPWYPANLHTDLQPLVNGRAAVIWLRPQMYEDVPYERWRFHAYVELMRGCRGWQFAHGPGDASLFRGLHGEMEFMKPIVASNDSGPAVDVQPWFEHWSRRRDGKTYVLAATTHGLTFGTWKWDQAGNCPTGRARVTSSQAEVRNEANSYGIGASAVTGPAVHGIQYLPGARTWPAGTKLVQWVQTDAAAPPTNLLTFIKSDGRWTHAAAWGTYDLASLRADPKRSYWFLQTFYRHADGFLGWDTSLVGKAMEYVPQDLAAMGAMPRPGEWIKLELPLEQVKAVGGLIDGVGSLHEGGIIRWGHTSLVEPDGQETVLWGDDIQLAPSQLAKVHIRVKGLHVAAKVKVLFEDRDLTAAEGEFTDDFRGADLYQRFGGGYGTGYGDAPVAFHGYEIQP